MSPREVVRVLLHAWLLSAAAGYDPRADAGLPASYREGELNEVCRSNYECGTYGYYCAFNRTCQCLEQYLPDKDKKVCRGGVEQRCQYDEHCIDGAFCMGQTTCRCKETRPLASFNGLQCSHAPAPAAAVVLVVTSFFIVLNT